MKNVIFTPNGEGGFDVNRSAADSDDRRLDLTAEGDGGALSPFMLLLGLGSLALRRRRRA